MVKKNFSYCFLAMLAVIGVIWLFYDTTVPTFTCREINRTPVEIFGPLGTIKNASPEILSRKFRYRVDIFNLSLNWREYKKDYGGNEYVHAYGHSRGGGVTILTDDPEQIWQYIEGGKRWIRVLGWPIGR